MGGLSGHRYTIGKRYILRCLYSALQSICMSCSFHRKNRFAVVCWSLVKHTCIWVQWASLGSWPTDAPWSFCASCLSLILCVRIEQLGNFSSDSPHIACTNTLHCRVHAVVSFISTLHRL